MKLIDLSQPISNSTPPYPGDPATVIKAAQPPEPGGCLVSQYQTSLHSATHIDAPAHMLPGGARVSEMDINRFWGRGVLFDVRGKATIGSAEIDLTQVQKGDAVLLYTASDENLHTEEYFTNHPTLTIELARALKQKGITMLGMDMCSPDRNNEIHKALMPEVILLENLTNLKAIKELKNKQKFQIIALPLKIEAEASQVRAAAIIEE